jgi:hypothetical protein
MTQILYPQSYPGLKGVTSNLALGMNTATNPGMGMDMGTSSISTGAAPLTGPLQAAGSLASFDASNLLRGIVPTGVSTSLSNPLPNNNANTTTHSIASISLVDSQGKQTTFNLNPLVAPVEPLGPLVSVLYDEGPIQWTIFVVISLISFILVLFVSAWMIRSVYATQSTAYYSSLPRTWFLALGCGVPPTRFFSPSHT